MSDLEYGKMPPLPKFKESIDSAVDAFMPVVREHLDSAVYVSFASGLEQPGILYVLGEDGFGQIAYSADRVIVDVPADHYNSTIPDFVLSKLNEGNALGFVPATQQTRQQLIDIDLTLFMSKPEEDELNGYDVSRVEWYVIE